MPMWRSAQSSPPKPTRTTFYHFMGNPWATERLTKRAVQDRDRTAGTQATGQKKAARTAAFFPFYVAWITSRLGGAETRLAPCETPAA